MNYSVYTSDEALGRRIEADWGSIVWLADGRIGNTSGLTLGRVVIKTGRSNPRHAHQNCEEALHLLSGRLEHSAGEETVTLEPGDTLVVAAGVFHNAASCGDDDANMIVAYSSATRDFVKEE